MSLPSIEHARSCILCGLVNAQRKLAIAKSALRRWAKMESLSRLTENEPICEKSSLSPSTRFIVLSVMLSGQNRDVVETAGLENSWQVLFASSWTEALATLQNFEVSVVLIDRESLGTDWHYLLNFFLSSVRHCSVILVTVKTGDFFCQQFIQTGGFEAVKSPLQPFELTDVVEQAWARWNRFIGVLDGS